MDVTKISQTLSIEDEIDRDIAILNLLQDASSTDSTVQLEELVNHIHGPYEKAEAYLKLFGLFKDHDLPLVARYLEKAVKWALKATELWQPSELLSQIGSFYLEQGQVDRAVETWNLAVSSAQDCIRRDPLQDGASCAGIMSVISINLSTAGMGDRGSEIANLIPFDEIREYTLQQISKTNGV